MVNSCRPKQRLASPLLIFMIFGFAVSLLSLICKLRPMTKYEHKNFKMGGITGGTQTQKMEKTFNHREIYKEINKTLQMLCMWLISALRLDEIYSEFGEIQYFM